MSDIDELIGKLAQDGASVKRAPHPFLLSLEWIAAALLYLAVALLISGMRHDLWPELHNPWFAAEIAALAGILVTTALSSALLSYPDLHQKRRIAYAPAAAFALFALVLWFACAPTARRRRCRCTATSAPSASRCCRCCRRPGRFM